MTGFQFGLFVLAMLAVGVIWVWGQCAHERWVRSQEALGRRFDRGGF